MLLVSTAFKSAILGPAAFESLFNAGSIHVYGGARVTSPDLSAPEANRLGIITRTDGSGLRFLRDGPFVVIPLGDWWQLGITGTGTASWFRLLAPADSGLSSTTDVRIDGDIGTPAAPADMVLASTALTAGTAVSIDSFLFTIPPVLGA